MVALLLISAGRGQPIELPPEPTQIIPIVETMIVIEPSLDPIPDDLLIPEKWQPKREVPPDDYVPPALITWEINCDNRNLLDGYLNRGFCVPGYIDNTTWFSPAPRHIIGKATWYSEGLMKATANWRGMDLTGFVGGVSLMSPADIGEVVWLKRPGENWEGPFLVVDCSTRGDMYATIVYVKESVEVDFKTAVRWGMVSQNEKEIYHWGLNEVEVYKGLRPPEDSSPVIYADWFLQGVAFDNIYEINKRWSIEMTRYKNYADYLGELK